MNSAGDAGLKRKAVLFVCLGNICRSPMAEAVFLNIIKDRTDREEWIVDSCATGSWHTGDQPDPRCFKTLQENGISNYKHTVRQVNQAIDFKKFCYIFGMDQNNIEVLTSLTPKGFTGKVDLLGKYDDENKSGIIRDPYYDNDDKGFKNVYDLSKRACLSFLEKEGF